MNLQEFDEYIFVLESLFYKKNTNREREYTINNDSSGDFDVFRKLIHMKLRNFYEKDYT